MRPLKEQLVPIERLTREPYHWFYGYYDNQPFSDDLQYHLCHRIPFMNHMPMAGEVAELGMIRLRDNAFIPLSETLAWNFQQGSMYQWRPGHTDEVIYNVCYGGIYRSVIQNVKTGKKRIIPMPVATVSLDGKCALSINFSRIFWFRAGYGYAQIKDPWENELHPKDDGVYCIDLDTGDCRLILSLDDMYKISKPYMETEDELYRWKYLVNHINLNTDASRFLVLFRGREDKPLSKWRTFTITANVDGSEPYLLLERLASHLHWRDPKNVMIYANTYKENKWGCYLFRDKTHEVMKYDPHDEMPGDGHCSFSPDRKYILNDTYPDKEGYRSLFIYDIEKEKSHLISRIATIPHQELADIDMRCDLHPRWSRDGSMISFDSVHEGHRHIYRIRVDEIMEAIGK